MEDHGNAAKICRDRLLAELFTVTDLEDGRAIWRAAKRYNRRGREARAWESTRAPLPHAWGSVGERAGLDW